MSKPTVETPADASSSLTPDLRDPVLAGILAWAVPGAGHWYQGRRTKAVLFFVCILSTFFYGLWLGEGRVVYASWGETSDEKRLPYVCQIGAGVVALPALVQARRYGDSQYVTDMQKKQDDGKRSFGERFMAPPILTVQLPGRPMSEIDYLNYTINRRFELGTIYTMIAGLLNILIIFDAIGGPAYGSSIARNLAKSESKEPAAPAEKPPTTPPVPS